MSPQSAHEFANAMSRVFFPSYVTLNMVAPSDTDGFVFHLGDSDGLRALQQVRSIALVKLAAVCDLESVWTGQNFHVSYY